MKKGRRAAVRAAGTSYGLPAAVAAILAGYGVYTNVSPYTLESSIQIRATPQQVWAVLADTAELRWIGRVGPGGIFDGEHTFTITQIRPGVVLFTQREDFTGVAVPFYEHWLHTDTLPMFGAMNAALAHRVTGG